MTAGFQNRRVNHARDMKCPHPLRSIQPLSDAEVK